MPDNKNKSEEKKPNCIGAFCREFYPCQAWFTLEEPTTGRKLDIPKTFGPFGALPIMVKILTGGYVVATQVYSWMESPNLYFYYAYYTSWALLFAVFYSILSFGNTICNPPQPTEGGLVQGRAKLTWIMFNLAIFASCLATLLYWTLVHDWDEKPSYLDVAVHGPTFLALLVDGMFISRIPLRWMHLWLSWAFLGLFLIWTVIHGLLDLGNPNEKDDDPETNDDAIYAALSWSDGDYTESAMMVVIVWFGVTPIMFGILRSLSIWSGPCCGTDRRRYYKTDEEEGYARWK